MTESTTGVGRLSAVVIDCPDPVALSRFYAALLGVGVKDSDADWVTLEREQPGTPALAFQRVADYTPPQWPDQAHPQQMHLDIDVADFDGADATALELGAKPASEVHGDKDRWRTYTDPAGHPFCLGTV
jgi:Glyoxalase-like domain